MGGLYPNSVALVRSGLRTWSPQRDDMTSSHARARIVVLEVSGTRTRVVSRRDTRPSLLREEWRQTSTDGRRRVIAHVYCDGVRRKGAPFRDACCPCPIHVQSTSNPLFCFREASLACAWVLVGTHVFHPCYKSLRIAELGAAATESLGLCVAGQPVRRRRGRRTWSRRTAATQELHGSTPLINAPAQAITLTALTEREAATARVARRAVVGAGRGVAAVAIQRSLDTPHAPLHDVQRAGALPVSSLFQIWR